MAEDNNTKSTESPVCVVGIGASAGGLEAICELLNRLPDNTGMAFVVIQHLSPDYKSMMSEILCKYTMMPVRQAEDGMIIERNAVYLIPPKYNMEVRNGALTLHELVHTRSVNHPIDVFLHSLSMEYESHAIAVILSGTGSDGANGIGSIKEQGGVILVQKPESSKFDGMPRSALLTGFVDKSLEPAELAEELTNIAASFVSSPAGMSNEELLNKIYSILKKVSNVNYTYYKQTTISRRIERRMVVNHITSLYDYVDMLRTNSEEASILARDVLIGVTSFFRDRECFDALKNRVIKPLVEKYVEDDTIRVWVAGCSTGEEAYSVGILFCEVMEELNVKCNVKIFATDLDKDAIATAGKGQYGENIIDSVSAQRLWRYFTKKNNTYTVTKELRKMIVFAPHNVFQDPPFGKLDLICCRNMLIYFQNVLQKDLFNIFHMVLNDGGYLFLGKSETISGFGNVFTTISPNEKIFFHNMGGTTPIDLSLRYHLPSTDIELVPSIRPEAQKESYEAEELRLKILEEFMPPCIVVDDKNLIRHTFGECNNFLRFPKGKIEYNLFGIITEDLRIGVSTALKAARDSGRRTTYNNIAVIGERRESVVAMTVAPLKNRFGDITEFTAVIFMEQGSNVIPQDAIAYDVNVAASQRISDLEKDLTKTQMNLKETVGELESVNEELQAANEELLTANEELQSSNEELQSVNEELYTVNTEYQEKLNEVTALNNDISNFLSSTLVGIIFLDERLQIRRFTNYVSQEFNLMDHDIGRSVQFMTYNFININLVETAQNVLEELIPLETDVVSASGKSYFLRISPYRTDDNKILGLVITFVDTTLQRSEPDQIRNMKQALSKAQDANREKDNFLSRISHDMRTPLNAIVGIAQLMKDYLNSPDEIAANLNIIQNNSEYLLGMINDILDTSRINLGKIEKSLKVVDELEFLNGIIPVVQNAAEEKNVIIDGQIIGGEHRNLLIDENHVKQILINIISNGIKYTPTGGKVDFITTIRQLSSNTVQHEYIISDTGCGMTKSFQKKMYEPFEQEIRDRTVENTGTGLGLHIVKKFIEAMSGTIHCESLKNAGTSFTIKLNYTLTENDVDDSDMYDLQIREHLKGKNVLLCEDHPINSEIAQRMLERIDMNCEVAVNGRMGVEKFGESKPGYYSAILMDIRMPEMDGREASVAIRALKHPDAKKIPIIAMTADAFAENENGYIDAGIDDSIYKPVDMKKLYIMLDKYID